jgi:hypothetical protein
MINILTAIGVIFLILITAICILTMFNLIVDFWKIVLQPKLKGGRERGQRKTANEQGEQTYCGTGKIQVVTSNT